MIATSTVDQGGALLIKYLSFILGLFTIFYFRLKWEEPWKLYISYIYIIWPLIAVSIGIINNGDISLAINNITPFIAGIIMLFLLQKEYQYLAIQALNISLLFMSVFSISIYLIFIIIPSSIESLSNLFNNLQLGFFGIKAIEETGFPGVYFKCTLFYNFAFTSYLFYKDYKFAFIILIAIILSFSKSSIIIALLIIFIFVVSGIKVNKSLKIYINYSTVIVLCLLVISIFLFFQLEYYETFRLYFHNAITGEAGTTQVRIGHYESVIKLFLDTPIYLIIGQGAGTEFFTKGFNVYTNNIELDHINAIRKFGLLWAISFYTLIIFSVVSLWKRNSKKYSLAYILTFILVGTNPLMINPLFIIITVIFYKFITNKKI